MRTNDVPQAPRWLDDAEQQAWRAFVRGNRHLMTVLDTDLQEHGISLPEYEILAMLGEQPGSRLRMSALADLVTQSRSRMTHTASRLAGRGFVERQPVPEDGRGVELCLTAAGQQAVQDYSLVHIASVRRWVTDRLTPAEFLELGRLMAIIRAGVLGLGEDDRTPIR